MSMLQFRLRLPTCLTCSCAPEVGAASDRRRVSATLRRTETSPRRRKPRVLRRVREAECHGCKNRAGPRLQMVCSELVSVFANVSTMSFPMTRLKFDERSVAALRAWDWLPTELKLMRSTPVFKRSLTTFLFQTAYCS